MSNDLRASLTPSLSEVLKALRRKENSLYNCLHSIAADAAFVREFADLYKGLPVCANLRCGLWYTPSPDLSCYFKSTDGHYGNWSFSTTRLNLSIALAAARSGGCIIVDSTRRGKSFPDSLTKTIPIWAAVLNNAVYRHRTLKTLKEKKRGTGPGCLGDWENQSNWDVEVHLPPWITKNERVAIERQVDSWVSDLLQITGTVEELAGVLKKPLRPLWVSQSSRIWLNEVPEVPSLRFTPLLLVSASIPNARQRRTHSNGGAIFDYLPGAGDDEESWGKGLTPQLFWDNHLDVLGASEGEVGRLVKALVEANKTGCTGACSVASPIQDACTITSSGMELRDQHHPPVQGCSISHQSQNLGVPCCIGDTGLALGGFAAGQAPAVWDAVDAVLNISELEHGKMQDVDSAKYKWLPIQPSKLDRHSLEDALPVALCFLSTQLQSGQRVLVHCRDGVLTPLLVGSCDQVLLCCFEETEPGKWTKLSVPYFLPKTPLETQGSGEAQGLALEEGVRRPERRAGLTGRNLRYRGANDWGGRDALSKARLRQCLAFVSGFYPSACPSRSSLKQVYNFARLHMAV